MKANRMKIKIIDFLTWSYLSLSLMLILMFYPKVDKGFFYIIGHTLFAASIFALIWFHQKYPANTVIRFFRYNYSLLALGFVYKSLEGYVLVLHGSFLDPYIIQLEQKVFGVAPTLWLEKVVSRPLTEFFYLNYFSYYFYMLVPALALNFQKRWQELDRFVFMISLTFYCSCIGFVSFPVEGPIYTMKDLFTIPKLTGYVFEPIQGFLMLHGDPHGTCLPSSHVAICWVALYTIRRLFGKKLFWILVPCAVFLTLSVVYNRYHYVSDVVAGLLTAWLAFKLGNKIGNREG